MRLRQHRRVGKRFGYIQLQGLPEYECGCEEPCFAGVPLTRLDSEFKVSSKLSREIRPRRKENRFLLNVMFCPLSNCAVRQCDRALSQLFTVSPGVIAEVRQTLEAMCSDPAIEDRDFIESGGKEYEHPSQPMNRYPDQVRERIESHLDMVIRADPAGSAGINVCRVYSPEVNTQEKLRKLLVKMMEVEEAEDVRMSDSTLQMMINAYLGNESCESCLSKQTTTHALTVKHCNTQ